MLRGQRIGGFEHSPCTCDDDGDYVDDEDEDYDDGFEPSSCAVTPVHPHRWHPLHGKSHRWRFSLAASSNVENYPIFNSPLVVVADTQSDSIQCLNFAKK